ncbi:hypothetical protein AVEN_177993-1 [Araneus ventricosus]|uniref:Uncharacterized protein n=1 Tax=Araneus ventricosus TaxID=182803 RepID=A0A4Y2EI21_ARAVE|nr:hypothetical protein AVEN_177993-1 [Araneus ventricosus]
MWSVRFLPLYYHLYLLFVAHHAGLCFEVIWLMSHELMDNGDGEDSRMGGVTISMELWWRSGMISASGRRVPGSKHDSIENPPCMWAFLQLNCIVGQTFSHWRDAYIPPQLSYSLGLRKEPGEEDKHR